MLSIFKYPSWSSPIFIKIEGKVKRNWDRRKKEPRWDAQAIRQTRWCTDGCCRFDASCQLICGENHKIENREAKHNGNLSRNKKYGEP
jgi:hypothetical protein